MNASERITNLITESADGRGKTLGRLRKLILEAAPGIVEEWKWSTAVWSHNGNVVAVGDFQDHVQVKFFKDATLNDPQGLFNAGLEAKSTRAIDIHEGDLINEPALKDLIAGAVALNRGKPEPKTPPAQKKRIAPKTPRR